MLLNWLLKHPAEALPCWGILLCCMHLHINLSVT